MSLLAAKRTKREVQLRRTARKGFEGLLFATLIMMLTACSGGDRHSPLTQDRSSDGAIQLSVAEKDLVAAWRAERGMSEGDALANVMLRRYKKAGHAIRYAGEGLYEVLDKLGKKTIVATFYVTPPQ